MFYNRSTKALSYLYFILKSEMDVMYLLIDVPTYLLMTQNRYWEIKHNSTQSFFVSFQAKQLYLNTKS